MGSSTRSARREIAEIREEYPRFTRQIIEERLWQKCCAPDEAAIEMSRERIPEVALSWDEVFNGVYTLEQES